MNHTTIVILLLIILIVFFYVYRENCCGATSNIDYQIMKIKADKRNSNLDFSPDLSNWYVRNINGCNVNQINQTNGCPCKNWKEGMY